MKSISVLPMLLVCFLACGSVWAQEQNDREKARLKVVDVSPPLLYNLETSGGIQDLLAANPGVSCSFIPTGEEGESQEADSQSQAVQSETKYEICPPPDRNSPSPYLSYVSRIYDLFPGGRLSAQQSSLPLFPAVKEHQVEAGIRWEIEGWNLNLGYFHTIPDLDPDSLSGPASLYNPFSPAQLEGPSDTLHITFSLRF